MSDLWKYSIGSRQSNKETIGREQKTVHMYREGRRGKRETNISEYRKGNACSSRSSSLKFKRKTDFTQLHKYRNLTGIFWIFFWWFKQMILQGAFAFSWYMNGSSAVYEQIWTLCNIRRNNPPWINWALLCFEHFEQPSLHIFCFSERSSIFHILTYILSQFDSR